MLLALPTLDHKVPGSNPYKGGRVVQRCCVSYVTEPASVAQLDAPSDWRPGGRGFNPR